MPKSALPIVVLSLLAVSWLWAPAQAANKEIVRFRLPQWKAAHFKRAKQAADFYAIIKSIGCEAKQHKHGDHIDVKYRCPKWRQLNLKSHAEAHGWEKWLKYYGFQTQHMHGQQTSPRRPDA